MRFEFNTLAHITFQNLKEIFIWALLLAYANLNLLYYVKSDSNGKVIAVIIL